MITLRTVPAPKRRLLFLLAALADIVSRLFSAAFQYDLVLFGTAPELADIVSVSTATGIAVPAIAAPIVLSPIAYVLGQVSVLDEANYVRLVSAAFIVGSFLCYTQTPALSILLAVLAYLILGSGILPHDEDRL